MVSLVGCCRFPGSRRRQVFIMVSFGCDQFDADRYRRSVPQLYMRTLELLVFTISPRFVNLIIPAPFNSDDIDWEQIRAFDYGLIGWRHRSSTADDQLQSLCSAYKVGQGSCTYPHWVLLFKLHRLLLPYGRKQAVWSLPQEGYLQLLISMYFMSEWCAKLVVYYFWKERAKQKGERSMGRVEHCVIECWGEWSHHVK
jgi:hypothetical protein